MARIAKARPKFIWVHNGPYSGGKSAVSGAKTVASTKIRTEEGTHGDDEGQKLDTETSNDRIPISRTFDPNNVTVAVKYGTLPQAPTKPINKQRTVVRPSSTEREWTPAPIERRQLWTSEQSTSQMLDDAEAEEAERSALLGSPELSISSNWRTKLACLGSGGREPGTNNRRANEVALQPSEPALLCGNSDPFTTTPLVVTPELNRVLTFMRDAILPAIYSTEILRQWSANVSSPINLLAQPRIISFQAAYGDWKQQVLCLHDEGMALAGLSAWCDLLPELDVSQTLVPSSSLRSSLMRARSCALLAKRLQTEQDLRSLEKDSVLHIFWLFRSEAISGSKEAARVHGDQLRVIIKHAWANDVISIQSLIQFLFVDVDLATACMAKTMFDVEGWFFEVLQPLWLKAKSVLPPIDPQVYLGLSTTVEIEVLVSELKVLLCRP